MGSLQALSEASPFPVDHSRTWALATDDVMLFRRGRFQSACGVSPDAKSVDEALAERGIVRIAGIDVNESVVYRYGFLRRSVGLPKC